MFLDFVFHYCYVIIIIYSNNNLLCCSHIIGIELHMTVSVSVINYSAMRYTVSWIEYLSNVRADVVYVHYQLFMSFDWFCL